MTFCYICNDDYGKCTDCHRKCIYLVFPYAVGPHYFPVCEKHKQIYEERFGEGNVYFYHSDREEELLIERCDDYYYHTNCRFDGKRERDLYLFSN